MKKNSTIFGEKNDASTGYSKNNGWLLIIFPFSLRFASVTVNLGPTFLSGALAANAGAAMDEPSCPLVQVLTLIVRGYSRDSVNWICQGGKL